LSPILERVSSIDEFNATLPHPVDQDGNRPGSTTGEFLITGSANLLKVKETSDSLAGRAETINSLGFRRPN